MGEFENLKAELGKWREGVKISNSEVSRVSTKNPYGQELYELNMAWAETRRQNEERIQAEKEEYEKKLAELSVASAEWKKEYGPWTAGRGRPKNPDYSDEVKMAAAKLLRASNRTQVRIAMGLQDTATLNRVLTEGEALLKAQEGAEW